MTRQRDLTIIARGVISRAVRIYIDDEFSIYDAWEDYPELTESDWLEIQKIARRLTPEPLTYMDAYEARAAVTRRRRERNPEAGL